MSTSVMRMMVDEDGRLSSSRFAEGVARLTELGYEVIASSAGSLPERRREIELILESDDDVDDVDEAEMHARACSQAFGTDARVGVITYISRGTDDDARGVLRRFGLTGHVARETIDGMDEVVTVTIAPGLARRVPESRLLTALEAALNCEVRLIVLNQG